MDSDRLHPDGFPLWRQLRAEPRFAFGVSGVLLLAALLACSLLPLWPVGPRNSPVAIRISGLAWMESRLQGRRAAVRSDVFPDASGGLELRQALALNPANLDVLRATIRSFQPQRIPSPAEVSRRIRETLWLLRVSGTNRADVLAVLGIWERLEAEDLIVSLVASLRDPVREELEYGLRSLARTADPRFAAWRRLLGPASAGSEMELLDLAAAGWGSEDPSLRSEATRKVEALAEDDGDSRSVLASRLCVAIHGQGEDATSYREALSRANRRGVDRPRLHAVGWRRLLRTGRREEAVQEAARFRAPPWDVWETVFVADTFAELGRTEDGLRYLALHGDGAEPAEVVWRCRCRLLGSAGSWEELLRLGVDLRRSLSGKAAISEGHAIEAWASSHLGRTAAAEQQFRRAAEVGFLGSQPARLASGWCREAGFLALALDVLRSAEPFPGERIGHLDACFRLALEIGDPAGIRATGLREIDADGTDHRLLENRILALEALEGDPAESLMLWETASRSAGPEHHRPVLGALALNRLGTPAGAWMRITMGTSKDAPPDDTALGLLAAAESLAGMGFQDAAEGLFAALEPESLPAGFLPRWERLGRRLEALVESADENRN